MKNEELLDNCKHQYQLKETKRQEGVRGGVYGGGKDWKRVDIYYCVFCLDEQIRVNCAGWIEYPDDPPDWW